jgi:hypothetical protein
VRLRPNDEISYSLEHLQCPRARLAEVVLRRAQELKRNEHIGVLRISRRDSGMEMQTSPLDAKTGALFNLPVLAFEGDLADPSSSVAGTLQSECADVITRLRMGSDSDAGE